MLEKASPAATAHGREKIMTDQPVRVHYRSKSRMAKRRTEEGWGERPAKKASHHCRYCYKQRLVMAH